MIQMQKAQFLRLVESDPDRLRALAAPVLAHRQELCQRYSRGSTPTTSMGDGVPFEYYITKMCQGYLAGKEPTYTVKGKEDTAAQALTELIDDIRRYNDDGATYADVMLDYLTTGAAYLYTYENDENITVYTRFDSRQTVAVYDYSVPANLIGCVRLWDETGEDGRNTIHVVETITDTERAQWRDKDRQIIEELQWGDVPVVPYEEPDGIAVYEPARSSIDTYEQLTKNIASMTQYNDNAKLLLCGYVGREEKYIYNEAGERVENPARKKEDEDLINAKVLYVQPDGDIRWLLKDVAYTGILDVMKKLHDNITMLTGVPNMTDEAFSNADNASALGYKLYALDQYAALADRIFRKGYLRLWELILGRKNLRNSVASPAGGEGSVQYDFRDITITMNRNVPTDKDKSIERAAKMKQSGLFSDETAIRESEVEVDPEEEIERRRAEEETEYETAMARGVAEEGEETGEPTENTAME